MKPLLLAAALLVAAFAFAQKSDELKLPITYVAGFGPFLPGYGSLQFGEIPENHPFYKALQALQYKNIPPGLKNVRKSFIFIDAEQWIYQTYKAGKISQETFDQVVSEQQVHMSLRNLTKDSIGCLVLAVAGTDEAGVEKLLVDYNNNGDFSDDEPVVVQKYPSLSDSVKSLVKYARKVNYQISKTASRQVPLLIMKHQNSYLYCFPEYAVANLKQGGITYKIALNYRFSFPSFWDFEACLYSDTASDKTAVIRRDEFLNINNHFYSIAGVNINTGMLLLKKSPLNSKNIESSQVGYPAISFTAKDILSQKTIALSDYKGKYVFVDFWGSWCGPCLAQTPHLIELYTKTDRSKIDFIGVVGKDTLENARKVITEKGISWPNVLSDKKNLLVEKYNNLAYPRGLLIAPDGKVVATELNSYTLALKLKELGLLK
jgi:thiol-disulfide isomerase/thioredoxin